MIDISVSGLEKSFDQDRRILDNLSFDVYEGEKVGLLGKNGTGKTTLFKILSGELDLDAGSIAIPRGKRVGLLSQIPVYPPESTVEDVLKSAFERLDAMLAEMKQLEQTMQTDSSGAVLARYGTLSQLYEAAGGYETQTQIARVAGGLSIPAGMLAQPFSSLSGGEQTRVNLARLILQQTDILLLDEPTNHLDLNSVEWLEEYLLKFKGTALIVSHDRYFLDRVITRIVELIDGKAEFYNGNYSFYVQEKERRYLESLERYEQEQRKIAQLEEAARRMHTWAQGHDNPALHKRAFAMEKRIERIGMTDRPQKERELHVRFAQTSFRGDEVLKARGISKRFSERTLFSGMDLDVLNGERIGLIGDNGSGKTTLMDIIAGQQAPDEGWLRLGPAIRPAYMHQIVTFENPQRNLVDTLIYALDCSPQTARNRLGAVNFRGEDVYKCVSSLSGGERSRLMLCILMAGDINFLMLDEPTNHMDVASREWIEECVDDFAGTLLFVSHDRYFIKRFATRIWEFADGKIYDFKGTYEQYREYKRRQERKDELVKAAQPRPPKKKAAPAGAGRSAAQIEGDIARTEQKLRELDDQMKQFASDYDRLQTLYEEKTNLEGEHAALYAEWEAAMGDAF